ncbi:MAG: hypothetical protein CM1200mP29_16060 [Verrucomicrobiota bacterium]|nr:MAG: hypothetical protein CM1200mP29_16060 [Verrucomicrobiota bacterium]
MGCCAARATPVKDSNQGNASATPVPRKNFRRSKIDKFVFMAFVLQALL